MMGKTRRPTDRLAGMAAVVLAGVLGLASQAWAVAYTFTPIAVSPADGYPTTGSINRDGTVAYVLTHDNGLKQVVKTDMNGVTTVVADNSGPLDEFRFSYNVNSTPVIDDSGTVAFAAWRDGGGTGIYAGNGNGLRTVAASSNVFSNVWRPYSNGRGQIVFTADLSSGQRQVIRDDGLGATTIVQTPGQFTSASARGIDSNGTVLFSASLDAGHGGLFLGCGGPAVEVARTGSVFQEIRDSSLSTYQAVFVGTPVGGGEGIYSFKDGAVTQLFGPSSGFIGFLDFAVNNIGGLIFLAGDGTVGGLYSGEDPTTPIVPIGAPLLGSAIRRIEMFPSLNDAGQFAFLAELADYRHVLVRADPVPEPTCIGLLLVGSLIANKRRLRR